MSTCEIIDKQAINCIAGVAKWVLFCLGTCIILSRNLSQMASIPLDNTLTTQNKKTPLATNMMFGVECKKKDEKKE